jgi:hypothetical protein
MMLVVEEELVERIVIIVGWIVMSVDMMNDE